MIDRHRITLIIPARNEAASISRVLRNIPDAVDHIIVVDNGSTDGTENIARAAGVQVVRENRPGYGRACLSGIDRLRLDPPAIVAFADGDGSDNHATITELLMPLIRDELDLVLAQRIPQNRAALSLPQRLGNRLATLLIGFFWGGDFRDLGPMRAIRWEALRKLNMRDWNYGWTIEMQIKALQHRLRVREIPLPYSPRLAGKSKVSRTFRGVIRASGKILWTVAREAWRDRSAILNGRNKRKEGATGKCGKEETPLPARPRSAGTSRNPHATRSRCRGR
jgi:glycosyltransferase involved in cell wall biosynthesis